MSTPVNALVSRYDAIVASSGRKHGSIAFKKWQRRFFHDEAMAIFDLQYSGAFATMLWVQFEELMMARALPQIQYEYLGRHGMWKNIPSKSDIAVQRFEHYMGDETKLENWQSLCRDLSLKVIPRSITQCRKAVDKVYVNIYTFLDQVEAGRPEPPIDRFRNFKSLQRWTEENGNFFPLKAAKEGGALRGLLHPLRRGRVFKNYCTDVLADDFNGLNI